MKILKRQLLSIMLVFLFLPRAASWAQTATYSLSSATHNHWKVAPQATIGKDSVRLFDTNYATHNWISATVPGTVFNDYVKAGLEKDPNFGDNIYQVDKSKYDRNFWYRTTFKTPEVISGQKLYLNFQGVNRKADVYFNGAFLGKLEGLMDRGRFDISGLVSRSRENVLALLVYLPQKPIPNYGTPAYISAGGWDWMPYVPGLLLGITDHVYLNTTGTVTMVDPWMRTKVPSLEKALLQLQVGLENNTQKVVDAELTGLIQPGNIAFSQKVSIKPHLNQSIKLDTATVKQFLVNHPKLWWPNGYGEPNLYTCELKIAVNGQVSDQKKFTFGIKEYSYDTNDNVFHIRINGKRVFVKGGNWGMSEYMLRCRGDEYDMKIKLHKEMNMNMIRNWIGSTTDEEFYEACDKYGIMVWDDFWLSSDKNLPNDIFAFNRNAVEKIRRHRNHPSIALWCGDNEGYPEPPINGWLAENVKTFDGGDRWYQANSHSDALTGSGPWTNFDPQWYFIKSPIGYGGEKGWGMRSEIGTAVFTTFESFKKFMPAENWWPRNEMWNKHFFGPSGGNAGPDNYQQSIDRRYGTATGIEDFCLKAQLLNIETNKALFEGWLHHMWNDASGVLTWMSQSAYPSLVWQTYDYYHDLNGAYWGVKKACEPLHVQWSYADNSVKVVNTTSNDFQNLEASAEIYNLDGKKVKSYKQEIQSKSSTVQHGFAIDIFNTSDNLAYHKPAVASTTLAEVGEPATITDGSLGSRWTSHYKDNQWIYVDLSTVKPISQVILEWEFAHAKSYKIQVSDDAKSWRDVFEEKNSDGGRDRITFAKTNARYVRMLALSRATFYGVSLFEFEVYEEATLKSPEVQLVKLFLKEKNGKLLSDNFYWRSTAHNDYTALNSLPRVKLSVTSKLHTQGDKKIIRAKIKNTDKLIAFAVKVQAVDKLTGERLLPMITNDDYFTLFPNEVKDIEISFDAKLLKGEQYTLQVTPYNNRKQ